VRASAIAGGETCARIEGRLPLGGTSPRAISLDCARASEVRLRLVPAYLPYLNLRSLEILGSRD